MSDSQMLQGKRAVIFGAGGSIGAAVAGEFAAEGAEVFLAGRTRSNVEAVAQRIGKAGHRAYAAVIDALDDAAVNTYVGNIVRDAGQVDIVFTAVGPLANEYGNTKHAMDLTVDEFMLPLTTVVKSQFIAARAAARHMIRRRSGVIVFLTGSPARGHVEGATAIGTAFGAIESLTENLAVELSPSGVRVVCLRTTANTDSRTMQQTMDAVVSKPEPSAVMEVVELSPDRVRWRCVSGPTEWVGTSVTFDLKSSGGETVLLFTHADWREPVEFMHHCSTKWATVLMGLRSGLEGGAFTAFPDDAKISGSWR